MQAGSSGIAKLPLSIIIEGAAINSAKCLSPGKVVALQITWALVWHEANSDLVSGQTCAVVYIYKCNHSSWEGGCTVGNLGSGLARIQHRIGEWVSMSSHVVVFLRTRYKHGSILTVSFNTVRV